MVHFQHLSLYLVRKVTDRTVQGKHDIDGEQKNCCSNDIVSYFELELREKESLVRYIFIQFSVANIHTEIEILGPQGAPS